MQILIKRRAAFLLLALLAGSAQGEPAGNSALTATHSTVQQFYLVRHAEKAGEGKDPPLSVCGQAQAKALAELLSQLPLQRLYHSGYLRTRQTAAAFQHRHLPLQAYDPRDLKGLTAHLLSSQDTAVLVAGHSNTTPELAELLSGSKVPAMAEQDYGRVYQLTRFGRGDQSVWAFQLLQLPTPAQCH